NSLQQLPGVSGAEALADGRIRLHYRDTDPSEALIEQAVANHWRLYELRPERRTLEQIFIELTCSEPTAATPGEAA
ncbi:MAG: DUF4162 domain-containing protein, partial [Gammaproteobacteria bacterium]|nr:DUF4162 domain-containing protein [Gammaproteobacteria bacterium]